MTVVSCYYDLSSKAQYPTQLEQVYQTIKTFCQDDSIDTEKIFVMGHSAGGNAAAAVTLLAQKRQTFEIAGEVLVYPVLDMYSAPKNRPRVKGNLLPDGMMQVFNEMLFEKPEDASQAYASPLLATDEQLRSLPPTYILICAKDNLRIDGLKYAKRLRELGVETVQTEADEAHGFLEGEMYNYYGKSKEKMPVAAEETEKIVQWINRIRNK